MQVVDLELKGHTLVKGRGEGGGGRCPPIGFSAPRLRGANFWSSNPHLPNLPRSTVAMLENTILVRFP